MTISFQNSLDAGTNDTVEQISLSGFSINAGDLMVTIVNRNGTGDAMTHDQSHTELYQADNTANGESHRIGIWYKIASASEPSEYTVSWSTTQNVAMTLLQFRTTNSFDAATVEDAAVATNATTDATNECSSITVADESVAIACSFLDTSAATYSSWGSYTLAEANTVGRHGAIGYKIFASGQATSTTCTWVDAEKAIGLHFSFKEDPTSTPIHFRRHVGFGYF